MRTYRWLQPLLPKSDVPPPFFCKKPANHAGNGAKHGGQGSGEAAWQRKSTGNWVADQAGQIGSPLLVPPSSVGLPHQHRGIQEVPPAPIQRPSASIAPGSGPRVLPHTQWRVQRAGTSLGPRRARQAIGQHAASAVPPRPLLNDQDGGSCAMACPQPGAVAGAGGVWLPGQHKAQVPDPHPQREETARLRPWDFWGLVCGCL